MIGFYHVDKSYTDYLRQHETRVPVIHYGGHDKFICGIVLNINGIEYYAPVSSKTALHRNSFPIYDPSAPKKLLSNIRFIYMFPCKPKHVVKMDFQQISQTDPAYATLLQKEQQYCAAHEPDILRKAAQVYKWGNDPKNPCSKICCNFKLLESVYEQFGNSK